MPTSLGFNLSLRSGNYATFNPSSLNSSVELLASLKEEFAQARNLSPEDWLRTDSTGTVYAPATVHSEGVGLKEERADYDVTMKLFYLSDVPLDARIEHTEEAVRMVCKELGISKVNLLLVSFPGVFFNADDEVPTKSQGANGGEGGDPEAPTTEAATPKEEEEGTMTAEMEEELQSFLQTYPVLEKLVREGIVGGIGMSDFGTARLARLLRGLGGDDAERNGRVRPNAIHINVRDCCVVPKDLILYTRRQGIRILTHDDTPEVLTREGLQEALKDGRVLDIFKSALAEEEEEREGDVHHPKVLKGDEEEGVSSSFKAGQGRLKARAEFGVFPQWVVKYNAVINARSVVENKG